MVSSYGAGYGIPCGAPLGIPCGARLAKPARVSSSMSNLAWWKIFSTAGSVRTGSSAAIAASSGTCIASSSCRNGR